MHLYSWLEVKALLEFFYMRETLNPTSTLALYLTADKQYLQEIFRDYSCRLWVLSNVLDIPEMSTIPSVKILKEFATCFAVLHMEEIFNFDIYKSFVRQNSDVSLYNIYFCGCFEISQLGSLCQQVMIALLPT